MDITFIRFSFPGLPKVHCAFQTRLGGYGEGAYGCGNISFAVGDNMDDVLKNRAALQNTLKLDALAELKQVHGVKMIFDATPMSTHSFAEVEGDGLASDHRKFGLIIKTADCQPVLLAHESGKYIAAMHVGWRGNEQNFPELGVQAFCRRYNLRPEELMAVRGPSLSPAAAEFVNFDQEWGQKFQPWYNKTDKTMDLWSLTRYQLTMTGLRPDRIFGLDFCTYAMNDLFFSYRREKQSGRQASIIWIE